MATWAMPLNGGAWLSDWAFAKAARTIVSKAMRARVHAKLRLEGFCRVMRYSVVSDEKPLSPMQVWAMHKESTGRLATRRQQGTECSAGRVSLCGGLEGNCGIPRGRYAVAALY